MAHAGRLRSKSPSPGVSERAAERTAPGAAKHPVADPSKDPLAVDLIVPFRYRRFALLVWLAVSAALVAGSIALAWPMGGSRWPFLGVCIPLAVGVFAVPLAFILCHRWLIEWSHHAPGFARPHEHDVGRKGAVDDWIRRELAFFKGSLAMVAVGATTAVLALLAYSQGEYLIGYDGAEKLFAAGVVALSSFLGGIGLYATICMTRMIWRFADFEIIVKSHQFGVLSTGRVIVKCYFLVGSVWSIYTLATILGSPHLGIKAASVPLLLLVAPTFVIILASFVICQVPLHNRMVEFKRRELLKVEERLDRIGVAFDELTDTIYRHIQFLEAERQRILGLPEWPFDFKDLLGAVVSSLTPALISSAIAAAVRSTWLGATFLPLVPW